MKLESKLIRVQDIFKKEIEEIREKREQMGLSKLSYSKITSLITRHTAWINIKEDIINFVGYEDES